MESESHSEDTDSTDTDACHSREFRLGLVMYGGVSLAIYIYGVAQEFFRAVRGRGVFSLIKALTDSDVVVDVISGTSAGGINGILLAHCLTNQLEFGEAASTWRRYGGLNELLRDPSDSDAESLLKGDSFFLAKLEETFERLYACEIKAPLGEDPSSIDELDLFVTSTDIHGKVETHLDSAGHSIDVKDHRVVFHLKHRAGRKEPFKPTWKDPFLPGVANSAAVLAQALAKVARSTSSFPVAFEPVSLLKNSIADADRYLRLWAWGPPGADRDVHLIDGGVLDNKPFTLSIREIYYRLSARNVDRKILYVEPDPEHFEVERCPRRPDVFEVALRSLSTIPSYESIADDLRSLREHNDRIAHLQRFTNLFQENGVGEQHVDAQSREFIARWHGWERAPQTAPQPSPPGGSDGGRPSPYAQCRLMGLSERLVQGLLRVDGHDAFLKGAELAAAQKLVQGFDRWPGSGDFTLYGIDVEFRLRRMFHVLYACPDPKISDTIKQDELWLTRDVLNRQTKLLELIHNAVLRVVDEGEFRWCPPDSLQAEWAQLSEPDQGEAWERWVRQLWECDVAAALLVLLNVGVGAEALLPEDYDAATTVGTTNAACLSADALTHVNDRLKLRVASIKAHLHAGTILEVCPDLQEFRSVLGRTDAFERYVMAQWGRAASQLVANSAHASSRCLGDEYDNFLLVDAVIFPLRSFSGIEEQDLIETVRISPKDAQRGFSGRGLADKLSGDALAHFGGFLKRSWRSNDILWGRLDGTCQLVETLFTHDRLQDVIESDPLRARIKQAISGKLGARVLFPRAPATTAVNLQSWLDSLVSDDAATRRKALADFEAMRDLLIEAEQFEILHLELPVVIQDAIEEQAEWNQFRVGARGSNAARSSGAMPEVDAKTLSFVSGGDGELDSLVKTVAAEELAKRALARIVAASPSDDDARSPTKTALGTFFRLNYRVGGESVATDIPLPVMLSGMARTLLVLRNCIAFALRRTVGDVRQSALYRFVGVVLWALQGMAMLMQRGAAQVLGVGVGLAFFAVLALVGAYLWHVPLLWGVDKVPSWPRWTAFVFIPVGILLAEMYLLYRIGTQSQSRRTAGLPYHPFNLIPPGWSVAIVKLLALATLLTAGFTSYLGTLLAQTQTDLINAPSLVAGFEGLEKETLAAVLVWDDGFIVAYTLLLSFLAYVVARWQRQLRLRCAGGWVALAWLAFAIGGADVMENLALYRLSQASPIWWINYAQLASHLKWYLPLLFLGLILVGGMVALARRISGGEARC